MAIPNKDYILLVWAIVSLSFEVSNASSTVHYHYTAKIALFVVVFCSTRLYPKSTPFRQTRCHLFPHAAVGGGFLEDTEE